MQPFPCSGCKKECASEFLGTYLLVFIGPGSIVMASLTGLTQGSVIALVAFVFGCAVALIIFVFGRLSAFVNPAITASMTAAGLSKPRLLVPFTFFQLVGGLLAGLSLKVVFSGISTGADLGSTKLALGVSPIEGLVLEAAGTFLLSASALTAATTVKSRVLQALLVGSTLFVLILLIGPFTGASFNPARSLGPSLFSGYLTGQIVYYAGPMVGGTLAGLTFAGLRSHGRRNKKLDIVCLC